MTNLVNQGLGLIVGVAMLLALLDKIDTPYNPVPALLHSIWR